ncbi:hypothetical protein OG285_32205 [Streptomyces sp. NBC_01471]|uniref:hypothetical protein n=1 Tax=Streptomyces sp. NBC_01471 TaxID=2903879 RepID=UPI00324DE5F3
MPTLCRVSSPATATSPTDGHRDPHDQPPRPDLVKVLDPQESEVPRTAHALEHFFPEA